MNYSEIKFYDISNGPGCRTSIFVSGCRRHCKGCFNQQTWSFDAGKPFTEETEFSIFKSLDPYYVSGLSFLGGEPFEPENSEALNRIAKISREVYPKKTIWCYTGYKLADILNNSMKGKHTLELLQNLDVLVDGEFREDLKDISLVFRGSSNQRIIDVPKTLSSGTVTLWTGPYDK